MNAHDAQHSFTVGGLQSVDSIAAMFSKVTENYAMAFTRHKQLLDTAQQSAEDAATVRDAILGVAIGIGVGLSGGAALEAVTAIKLLQEVGGELIELGVSKSVEAMGTATAGAAQNVPAGLSPEALELEQTKSLVDLYRLLAGVQATTNIAAIALACKDIVIEIERYEEARNRFPAEKIDVFVKVILAKESQATAVMSAVAAAKAEIDTKFKSVIDKTKLSDPQEFLKDLWIRWLAAGGDPRLNDDIARELIQWGIIDPTSWNTSNGYTNAAEVAEARAQRGRAGVALNEMRPAGEVEIDGRPWAATASEGSSISAGTPVRVIDVNTPWPIEPIIGVPDGKVPPLVGDVRTFVSLVVTPAN